MKKLLMAILLTAVLLMGTVPSSAANEDWDIPNGHFFTQTGGGNQKGYAVTDEGGVKFWTEFQRLGGPQAIGYPVSERFEWDGFTVQGFQRVVLQWRADAQQAYFVNVFDILSEKGKDEWLLSARQTPKPSTWSEDGLSWNEIVKKRLSVMDGFPEIAKVYGAVPGDPVAINGLPVAEVADMGTAFVMRAQRVVIQQWKEDVPWARKGQVTVANGGDIGKELGLYPSQAVEAQSPRYDAEGRQTASTPPAPASSTQGRIVFTSNRDSWDDVFIMDADGSNQKRLTSQGRSYAGALSPDGKTIAYDAASSPDKRQNYKIYSMNTDGSDVKRLTDNIEDWYPSWSPDGRRIAYYSYRGGQWDIWTMNADATDQRRLYRDSTHVPLGPVAWSPSGTFAWGRDDATIRQVDADGSGYRYFRVATPTTMPASFPAWSSDGKRLAFSGFDRVAKVFQIWVANADGGAPKMLTSRGQNFWPSWSPDGSKIAFSSYRDGNWEVYIMNADGSNQVNLTKANGDDKAPHWSR